jgi:hypothetical protein
MGTQPIQFGDEGQAATRELLRRCDALAPLRLAGHATFRGQLETLQSIDKQYGGSGALALEDSSDLVAALHTQLAHWEAESSRRRLDAHGEIADIAIGVGLWAMRHGVEINVVEPLANALARRSNAARGHKALGAVAALMQGVIAHVAPRLRPDLERSNPERAWRVLHVNLAITAIRTEDPALIDAAFDALDAALPDERTGFYAEAMALALAPKVAKEVRSRIEERHRKWT